MIDFPDLRDKFLGLIDKERGVTTNDDTLKSNIRRWRNDRDSDWTGCTIDEMRGWIADGYEPPEIEGAFGDAWTNDVPRRKLRLADEGDLDVSLALSGHDYPFLRWDQRPRKPGLSLHVDLAMHCGTPASVIAEYGAWLAGVIRQFETKGYDLEVNVSIAVAGLEGFGTAKVDDVLIRLKRENEISDFTQWSPMFSPGGFRMLGFCAMSLAAEHHGFQASGSLGRPMGERWKADFNPELRVLRIESPNGAQTFDGATLTEQLNALGI